MPSVILIYSNGCFTLGGMREVPYVKREILMTRIRDVLFDKSINPFYFQYDFARVISGEEEV